MLYIFGSIPDPYIWEKMNLKYQLSSNTKRKLYLELQVSIKIKKVCYLDVYVFRWMYNFFFVLHNVFNLFDSLEQSSLICMQLMIT